MTRHTINIRNVTVEARHNPRVSRPWTIHLHGRILARNNTLRAARLAAARTLRMID